MRVVILVLDGDWKNQEEECATNAEREALRAQVHSRVSSDPATAALVLRYWLGTDAPSQKT